MRINNAYAKKIEEEIKKTEELPNFIDEGKIHEHLENAENPDKKLVLDILDKAKDINFKGLTQFETAVLLQNKDLDLDEAIFEQAKKIKEHIYGNRMVLFAPLYVTNLCNNNCVYCGFAARNKELNRKTLTLDEIAEETKIIEDMGHKRILMVYGEFNYDVDWLVDTIKACYATKSGKSGEIRRININCAPLDVEGFRKLKEVGNIGTYQCFHETYHQETYKKVHPMGHKASYKWRLYALHRCQEAGLDDVSTGALFGLYNHKFEALGLLQHAQQLEKDFGVGPHTISFPRIEPALGSEMSYNPPAPLTDHEFKKLIAVLRIAVPYTGLILSTRETGEFRSELLKLGISQISAASKTYPGGYKDMITNKPVEQQFCVGDERSLDDVIHDLVTQNDYMPSFCTGCYRQGRTGDHFMGLAKSSFINRFCGPNAMFTFLEYLNDYASDKTKDEGRALIKRELEKITDPVRREKVREGLNNIDNGVRDIYF
jgi:2-iminoacetate synthase